jgi:N-acetylglucosaminyldiphosphoundecaprenol N-acetyl-beta-D-mannosaminyltransferase
VRASLDGRQLSLGGVRVDALERRDLIEIVDGAKAADDKQVIFHHNLHSLYLYETDADFRASYERASWVYIDGMPIVWLGGLAGLPLSQCNRTTLLESFEFFLDEAAQRGWRVFYLGSSDGVVERGLKTLRARFPSLAIAGRDGFFPKGDVNEDQVIAEINRFHPDLLFVGMGMPLQEKWVVQNKSRLQASAIMTSGGTLDYVTGDAYKPPSWAGRLGLYGVFRMVHDPRRLWRRYLVEPIVVVKCLSSRIVRQRAGLPERADYRVRDLDERFVETDPAGAAD